MNCLYHGKPFISSQQAVEELAPYSYTFLPSERSIRLFTLCPGSEGDPIRGRLSVEDVDNESLEYKALSYVWGDTNPQHAIECDGRLILVNCSLFSALNRLREEHAETLWFVDYISINQSTEKAWLKERNFQVRQMGDIFSQASAVVVDLGEDTENMTELVDLLDELGKVSKQGFQQLYDDDHEDIDTTTIPPFRSGAWKAFGDLCQRPWFNRIWVIQEYNLAKKVQFIIGKFVFDELPFYTRLLAGTLLVLRDRRLNTSIGADTKVDWEFYKQIENMQLALNTTTFANGRLWGGDEWKEHLTLWEILAKTQHLLASNKRDRIYGIIGLIKDPDMSGFIIDYSESVRDLSFRLNHFLPKNDHFYKTLHLLAGKSADGNPSWMIDLEKYQDVAGIDTFVRFPNFSIEEFKAGGEEQPTFTTIGSNCLLLKGIEAGSIDLVSRTFPLSREEAEKGDLQEGILSEILDWDIETSRWFVERAKGSRKSPQDTMQYYRLTVTGGGKLNLPGRLTELSEEELRCTTHEGTLDPSVPRTGIEEEATQKVHWLMKAYCRFKRVGVTGSDQLCVIPEEGEKGDIVAVFKGLPVPWLVRRVDDGYRLLGGVYMHGIMRGEALVNTEGFEDMKIY